MCSACSREWHQKNYVTHIHGLKVHSAVLYSQTASKVIFAAKEKGIKAADELIIDAIIFALNHQRLEGFNVRLVPIPSSPGNQRRRGRSFIVDLCQEISQRTNVPISPVLSIIRKVKDHSSLNAMQRHSNIKGAFGIRPGIYPRGDLILIDDVVTTGATVAEAARTLNSHGFHLLGSVTACVAQPLR